MKRFQFAALILVASIGLAGAQVTGTTHNRTLATAKGLHLGAAVTFPTNAGVLTNYDTILTNEYNTLVCENAMKFGTVEATRNKFSWTTADATVKFATDHGMYMRGHNFIWYQQSGFLANLNANTTPRDTFLAIIKNHIDSVCGRYKGKIYEWDVVNEAIDESQTDGNRRSFLYTLNGGSASYIDSAFVYAHRVDPSANLIYNDYNGEGSSTGGASVKKSDFIYNMVAGMKSRGIPINGVGFQCHLTAYDTAAIGANMSRLEALGLSISITEMDVSISSATDTTQLNKQAGFYKSMMALCLRHPGCKTFLTWGVMDATSWHSTQYPLLFTGGTTGTPAITPKAAYYGIQQALGAPSVAIWKIQNDRPGVLRQNVGMKDGSMFFNTHGSLYNLQGRQLQALPLPK